MVLLNNEKNYDDNEKWEKWEMRNEKNYDDKHMIFGWKIMAAVKTVTDWIFLFGFSFIQCHVTSFPYLDCAWGWSLQSIKWLCWSCLHCFLDFGLIHHQDHLIYKIYPSNWAVTTWLNLIPTCLTFSVQ